LTLFGSMASFVRTDDHPWMPTLEERATTRALTEKYWGTGRIAAAFFPVDQVRDANMEDFAVGEIACASPGAAGRLLEMDENIDVRSVLPTISVPTLVVHATGDTIVPFQCAEYLARHIPNARLLPLDYAAHFGREPNGPIVDWVDDLEEFITGVRPVGFTERVLSTVLYTDIVDSTRRAASLGDARWKQILDRHDLLVGREIDRHRGVHVKSTGDGVLARFDGPARAVSCGLAIAGAAEELGLAVRAGLHTGEIELRGDDIGGLSAHIGARVASLAGPGEVLVSRTVRDLVAGSGLSFSDRGEHELKGVPDRWHVYAASRASIAAS